jgi:cyclic beta-1,2-glucan synthetase
LFTPPFDHTARDPGYIKGYPPGLRENGGQYSHAAMWAVLAFAKLGDGANAAALFALLNPINHARTPMETERYKVEPYVVAADIYSVAPHVGRGGWSWYTGAGGWMYQAGIEGILGIRREGAFLVINPCIPPDWPGFEASVKVEGTRCDIRVISPSRHSRGISRAVLDGQTLQVESGPLRVALDGALHDLRLEI